MPGIHKALGPATARCAGSGQWEGTAARPKNKDLMNTPALNTSNASPERPRLTAPKVLRVVHSIHREKTPAPTRPAVAALPKEMTDPHLKPCELDYLNWYHGDPLKCSFTVAHAHSMNHRSELQASQRCGCFQCGSRFAPAAITQWVRDAKDDTAFCPHCDIDAVIGDASGYPITPEFLAAMQERWFG